jgi:hypothetical protein
MKRNGLMLAVLALSGVAFAQAGSPSPIINPLPDMPEPLTGAQINDLTAYGITLAGGLLVRPVTAVLQSWGPTSKVDPKLISGGLSLLMVTGVGIAQGVYGSGAKGVLGGLLAGAAAFLYSYAQNRAASISAEGGTRRAILGRAKNSIGDVNTRGGLIPNTSEELPALIPFGQPRLSPPTETPTSSQ